VQLLFFVFHHVWEQVPEHCLGAVPSVVDFFCPVMSPITTLFHSIIIIRYISNGLAANMRHTHTRSY
jgi:hypothetical protein